MQEMQPVATRVSTASPGAGRVGPRPYPAPTEASDLLEAAPRRGGAPLYETSDDDDAYGFDGVTAGRDDGSTMPRTERGRPSASGAPPPRFMTADDDTHALHGDDEAGGGAVKEGLFTACGLDKIGRYAVGVCLLIIVAIIWVAASEWIQHIYGALDFNKPYFITFFNTSMFALYNLGYVGIKWWRAVPWAYPGEAEAEKFFSVPRRRLNEAEAAEAAAAEAAAAQNMNTASTIDAPPEPLPPRYSRRELLRCACCFCPLWFLANVLFNYSLSATSVSSNTILSTTSSVWTLAFAKFILKAPTPLTKLGALVLTLSGTVMVAYGDDKDSTDEGHDSLLGDILALVSAFFYASYTTVLRYFLPDERRYSMPMVFGMVGVVNMLLMWPGLIVLSATGVEPFELPTWAVLWPLAINGLIGTNLSDVLWAKAVILTSPFVATLGLSLTTPFAMVADLVLHQTRYSGLYITGAIVVTAGFIVSNL